MKTFLTLFLSLTLSLSIAQEQNATEEKTCNQIPIARPDQKAKCADNYEQILSQDIPESLLDEKSHWGNFKLIVNCNGQIDFVTYQKGTLTTEEQKHFLALINKLKQWTSAVYKKETVSTYVFISIKVENNQISVELF